MVRDISQFTICVARFLLSHVRFYPPFMPLLAVTRPLLFSELGKKSVYKILKTSHEELSDLVSLTNADFETTINATRPAVSLLYDPKGKFKLCHHDLNMLRVKLATNKDSPLSRIPPSEPSFKQHVQKGNKCLEPVLLTGMMSSDFLQDLICSCKCRYACKRGCVCYEQSLIKLP